MRKLLSWLSAQLIALGVFLGATEVANQLAAPSLENELYGAFSIRPGLIGLGFGNPTPPKWVILDLPAKGLEYRRQEGSHYYTKDGKWCKHYEVVESYWTPAHEAWVGQHEQEASARQVWAKAAASGDE